MVKVQNIPKTTPQTSRSSSQSTKIKTWLNHFQKHLHAQLDVCYYLIHVEKCNFLQAVPKWAQTLGQAFRSRYWQRVSKQIENPDSDVHHLFKEVYATLCENVTPNLMYSF